MRPRLDLRRLEARLDAFSLVRLLVVDEVRAMLPATLAAAEGGA